MVTVQNVLDALFAFAPESYKESWDNIGFLLGHRDAQVTKILVALDATEAVAEEAARRGCELVVTHHPLIFRPVSSVTDETTVGKIALAFLERRLALISMHTNLDCAPGGVNDRLAEEIGLHNVYVLADGETAGLIRIGEVEAQTLPEFGAHVKAALHAPGLRVVDSGKPVRKVAVGGGACSGFIEQVAAESCDTFVTADLKYHEFGTAQALGINLIDAGHFHTEDPVCAVLVEHLRGQFPALCVEKSAVHTGCIRFL